jgi:hypothetical protein
MKETLSLIVTIISMIFGIVSLADSCCGPDENALINSRGKMDLYDFKGTYIFKKETKSCDNTAKDIETITIGWNEYRQRLQYNYSKVEANCKALESRKLWPAAYASCDIEERDIRKYTQYTLTELANLKTNTVPRIKNAKYAFSVIVNGSHFVGLETSQEWEHFNYLRSRIIKACNGLKSVHELDSIMQRLVKQPKEVIKARKTE